MTSSAVFLLSKPLSAYQLGESYAKNLSECKGLRTAMVLLSSILSACIVAFAGPISFRRDCSAAFGKAVSFQYKADLSDSGMFLRRKCILLIL